MAVAYKGIAMKTLAICILIAIAIGDTLLVIACVILERVNNERDNSKNDHRPHQGKER